MSHLLWQCPATRDLRCDIRPPKDRGEDRMLAVSVPNAPLAENYDEEIDHLNKEEVQSLIDSLPSERMIIATDGGSKHGHAAWAIATNDGDTTGDTLGLNCTPYRAELEAARMAIKAVSTRFERDLTEDKGRQICIIMDCQSVIDILTEASIQGECATLIDELRGGLHRIRKAGGHPHLCWVPSHDKKTKKPLVYPNGITEKQARELNARADAAATRTLKARAGSQRTAHFCAEEAATTWSRDALELATRVKERYIAYLAKLAGDKN